MVLSTIFNAQSWSPNLTMGLRLHPFPLWYDSDKGVESVLVQQGSLYGGVWVRIAPRAREDISCITASNHRGRAETVYQQGCPFCSRQYFWVKVFCLCFTCCWAQSSNIRPNTKQNRDKIHSHENVVCYRKDNPAGTHFLPSPCEMSFSQQSLLLSFLLWKLDTFSMFRGVSLLEISCIEWVEKCWPQSVIFGSKMIFPGLILTCNTGWIKLWNST